MSKRTSFVVIICLLAGGASAQSDDLIISEYVGGSFLRNEAIEIYNGTGEAVNIGNYQLHFYLHTGGVFLVGPHQRHMIAPGETYVMVDERATPDLLVLADDPASQLPLYGVNTVVLVRDGEIVDSIGQRYIDSSSGWSCAEGSTIDQTLRRLPDVCSGDSNPDDVFDPCQEWAFFPVDTIDDLGSHTANCQPVNVLADSWGSVKSSYR